MSTYTCARTRTHTPAAILANSMFKDLNGLYFGNFSRSLFTASAHARTHARTNERTNAHTHTCAHTCTRARTLTGAHTMHSLAVAAERAAA